MEVYPEKTVYRNLGNTGLRVSLLSYGNYLNANKPEEEKRCIDTIKKCWELGVNFFDTAEIYGYGSAEVALGKAIKEIGCPRDEIVISTKLIHSGPTSNGKGLSRKHIIEGMRASLKRLDLDYVDVVFAHAQDHDTPLEE